MKKKYCLAAVVFLLTLQSFAQFIDDVEYPPGATPGDWWVCNNSPPCNGLPSIMGGANTGEYSIIVGALPFDYSLSLGNRTSGVWGLSFYMFVPTNKEGYFNLQGIVPIGTGEWIVGNIWFNQDIANPGGGYIDNCVGAPVNFNFPHDEWFRVIMNFDLSAGIAEGTWEMYIGEEEVIQAGTPFTDANGTIPTSLGGVSFYDITGDTFYYLDTFAYTEGPIPPATEFTDDMEYPAGIPESSFWWPCTLTNDCSMEISEEQVYDGTYSGYVSDTENTNQVLNLTNVINEDRGLEFYMYVPSGKEAVMELQGNAAGAPIESIVGDVVFNDNNTDPGSGYIEDTQLGQVDFDFPHDQWFKVAMQFDLEPWIGESTWAVSIDNSVVIPAGTAFTNGSGDFPSSLGSLNFKAENSTSGYYLDAFSFTEESVLSISDQTLNTMKIVPNPVTDRASIQGVSQVLKLSLIDVTGKERQLPATSEIDLSEYASGIYFLRVETSEGVQTQKIIIN